MTELINSSHCCFKVPKMSESINPQDIKGKCKFSHFDLEKRKMLSESIKQKMKLQEISDLLKMNPSSISREIKRNRTFQQNYRKGNRCKKSSECKIKFLCKGKSCKEYCRQCGLGRDCNKLCTSFDLRTCNRLSRFPFVCDGCKSIRSCVIGFYHYIPTEAEKKAKLNLIESRRGINLTADQFSKIDSQLVEGTKLGQSVEHMATYCDFPVSTRTLRRYIDSNITTIKKMDTPRGAVFKPRKQCVSKEHMAQIRNAKEGRDLASFIRYMETQPFLMFSELDTVLGKINEPKRLLTIISPITKLFYSVLLPNGKSISIKKAFDHLFTILGRDDYTFMFGVLLTDNGSEFSRPEDIEVDSTGEIRSRVFFCNPYSSWQKGSLEVCHELLRRIIPKGSSFLSITPDSVSLINSHINSYTRQEIGGLSSYDLFVNSFGKRGISILKKLNISRIDPDKVYLKPELIK